MIRLAISGCCGKMGQRILNLALQEKDFKIACALENKNNSSVGMEISGLKVIDDVNRIKEADVLIEFSTPEATIEHLIFCLKYKRPMVIGTTGFSQEQIGVVKSASKKIPILFSPNMSIGVNLLFKLIREASKKLSGDYKISITETHHIHKKDAPSGTAKQIAKIIKDVRKEDVKEIKSNREGETVGDHEVIFDSPCDTIKLVHSAKTRDIFAKGAIFAAKWIVKKKNGLFSMEDVL